MPQRDDRDEARRRIRKILLDVPRHDTIADILDEIMEVVDDHASYELRHYRGFE